VVATWAGIQTADKQHTYTSPNDIFYVTSKDGGKTWTEPMKVTDSAKDGGVAGYPQVVLLDGVIHLLYTQGSRKGSTEMSPGLTRSSGEDPWPI
jgi:Neuraminidase (sialidase)